ncbi:hypothetical protein [Gryllotalpicola ginsengisoli]|uniref:hypothetical protein n=1 Tax=Gryllotalpicola ginsengisoli TaxID=444608 RepID=UPI0003B69D9E|nr:hypothetical protein [Gryllotalpicola ginsengisoli]
MKTPRPLPEPLTAAPFTVADADAFGIARGRLQAADLTAPLRAVRIPRHVFDAADDAGKFELLCKAYSAKMPPGWFFSHVTAARILGVPVPLRLELPEVHVTSRTPGSRPRGRDVHGHCAPDAETSRFFGYRVRVPAELWCELAPMLTVDELIAAGDRMLSEKPFLLTTRHHLEAAVAAHGSGRGARALREALPQLRENVWSPKETWTRLVLLRAGLPEPERNRRIYDRSGRLVAIGDLVYPQHKVLIEYEGERWHRDARSLIDVDRFNRLSILGWTIVRVRKHHSAADVGRMVRAALVSRGWRG